MKWLCDTVIPLLLALILLEIILAVCGPRYYKFSNNSTEYYTNPRGYYDLLKHDGKDAVYGLLYRYDREGFRLPESGYSLEEKDTPNNILVLGDSFTSGQGVRYQDVYTSRLKGLLDRDGFPAAIKNCGVAGDDLNRIYEVYKREARLKNFRLVIYGFVLNDFGVPRSVGFDFIDTNNGGYRFDPLRKYWRLYNLVHFLSDKKRLHDITLKQYLDAFKEENAERGFALLKALDQDAKKHQARLIIMVFPLLYRFDHYPFREIHEKLARFCNTEGIMMLDLFPAFSMFKAEDLWANPTDQHPNEIAHRKAAEELYKFLVQNALLKNASVSASMS